MSPDILRVAEQNVLSEVIIVHSVTAGGVKHAHRVADRVSREGQHALIDHDHGLGRRVVDSGGGSADRSDSEGDVADRQRAVKVLGSINTPEAGHALSALTDRLRAGLLGGAVALDVYEAAMKLLYLVLNHAAEEWKRPPREWFEAKTQFAVLFGDRFMV